MGWTQEKIADIAQIDQSVVSKIMQNISFDKMHNDYEEGKDVNEIAQFYGLDFFIWQRV